MTGPLPSLGSAARNRKTRLVNASGAARHRGAKVMDDAAKHTVIPEILRLVAFWSWIGWIMVRSSLGIEKQSRRWYIDTVCWLISLSLSLCFFLSFFHSFLFFFLSFAVSFAFALARSLALYLWTICIDRLMDSWIAGWMFRWMARQIDILIAFDNWYIYIYIIIYWYPYLFVCECVLMDRTMTSDWLVPRPKAGLVYSEPLGALMLLAVYHQKVSQELETMLSFWTCPWTWWLRVENHR